MGHVKWKWGRKRTSLHEVPWGVHIRMYDTVTKFTFNHLDIATVSIQQGLVSRKPEPREPVLVLYDDNPYRPVL